MVLLLTCIANLAWQLDCLDFSSESLFIHLANLQQQSFLISLYFTWIAAFFTDKEARETTEEATTSCEQRLHLKRLVLVLGPQE